MRAFRAVTYDVCPHESLFEAMNSYVIEKEEDIEAAAAKAAAQDVAPVVHVYQTPVEDESAPLFYKEYTFDAYTCRCGEPRE
ncbi:hypothetical protein [Halobacillus kuroshimensis]|uniref:hypothetical protein n=1 Tax=Halobacillus kuroshimensis TaxID=302481 RepID=UPI0003FD09D0|nr:hypothetical protein [Halobacillus kuroshimensis]